MELGSFFTEIGAPVHRTTMCCTEMAFIDKLSGKKTLYKRKKVDHLEFAKRHNIDSPKIWKTMLWWDETKINIFGNQGQDCGTMLMPIITHLHTKLIVKHGDGNIMLWECFLSAGTRNCLILPKLLYKWSIYVIKNPQQHSNKLIKHLAHFCLLIIP